MQRLIDGSRFKIGDAVTVRQGVGEDALVGNVAAYEINEHTLTYQVSIDGVIHTRISASSLEAA